MPIEGQAPELRKLADDLALEAEGMTQTEAWGKGICVHCKQEALPKCHTDAGRGEYRISAMCEECFDKLFSDEDETWDEEDY